MAARGGHWWSWVMENKVLGFRWAFSEEERGKNRVFHAEERIYNLQISPSELISLNESPLFATLSALILAQRNFLSGWNYA